MCRHGNRQDALPHVAATTSFDQKISTFSQMLVWVLTTTVFNVTTRGLFLKAVSQSSEDQ